MDMNSGATSPRVNRGAPQSEQKLRVARLPLPARTEYVFGVPVISTSDARTIKPEAKGAPLERWQSPQWQMRLSDAGLRRRKTKLLYLHRRHSLTYRSLRPHDRLNRLLAAAICLRELRAVFPE